MQQAPTSNYFRHDMITLAVIVIIMAATVSLLWYAEQQWAWFSRTATTLLDSAGR